MSSGVGSLEERARRKPDTEGTPVELRGGESFLIPAAELRPVFEKENGQWLFRRFTMGEPFGSPSEKIREIWESTSDDGKLSLSLEEMGELQALTMELVAAALDANYDLTADQLAVLIDPTDQVMISRVMLALRGAGGRAEGKGESDEEEEEEEKKTS